LDTIHEDEPDLKRGPRPSIVTGFLSDPQRTIEQTLDAMIATPHLGEGGPHPVVASAARELKNKSDNERSGG
jgi:type IV secretion system protein VirD4